jgi:hypothetical protein
MKTQIKQSLVLGVSVLAMSGCTSMHHATHWEYKIVPSGNYSLNSTPPPDWPAKQEAMLDSLGKDGWILVTESNGYFYFRRPQK